VLQCDAVCHSAVQCVAVCCSVCDTKQSFVLQIQIKRHMPARKRAVYNRHKHIKICKKSYVPYIIAGMYIVNLFFWQPSSVASFRGGNTLFPPTVGSQFQTLS